MKKNFLLFYFLLAVSALSAQSLVGTWSDKSKGGVGAFVFDKDGFASMLIDGALNGGKRFEVEGSFYCMKYVLQKDGRSLDLIIYDLKTNKETQRMLCIVEWISEDQIKLCIGMDEPNKRPKDFSKKEDVVILTRQ